MKTSTAAFPFDRDDADVVLRSSDDVDFHVHKVILCLSSPFFDDMFGMPQPSLSEEDVHPDSRKPLVAVSEGSKTLRPLLLLCYPVADPPMTALSDVGDLLETSIKYEMAEFSNRMEQKLRDFIPEEPIGVYAIACRLDLEDTARAAAHASLRTVEIAYHPELDKISAGAFYRLLEFRRQDAQDSAEVTFSRPRPTCPPSPAVEPNIEVPCDNEDNSHPFAYSSGSDVILRSSDGTCFYVHKLILEMASSEFAKILQQSPETNDTHRQLPIFDVAEDVKILRVLLLSCYPYEEPDVDDNLSHVAAVLRAATKYQLKKAIRSAKCKLTQLMEANPLRVYFVAAEFDWKEGARQAATMAICETYDAYVPEMEDASANVYHKLLEFRVKGREILRSHDQSGSGPYHWSKLTNSRKATEGKCDVWGNAITSPESLIPSHDWFFCGYQTSTASGTQRRKAVVALSELVGHVQTGNRGYSHARSAAAAIACVDAVLEQSRKTHETFLQELHEIEL
ncbi:uncharacterized protein FIBRA_01838 [Fibroporia radiculosa]|uniref:BTB domain-containing protein n=1 Tax=Fibroporia radiculosa TaxID=599839 RepID=J4H1H0_9APHY|nr:uncharacterized protein FIBRA_01838 [Fibroporia radiculosa]CCL99814.1 predicted protein [Fibroporia radiculosa]